MWYENIFRYRIHLLVCFPFFQANVETVMASEKGAVQLMNMLDRAVDEISKIDGRLGLYEKKLSVCE